MSRIKKWLQNIGIVLGAALAVVMIVIAVYGWVLGPVSLLSFATWLAVYGLFVYKKSLWRLISVFGTYLYLSFVSCLVFVDLIGSKIFEFGSVSHLIATCGVLASLILTVGLIVLDELDKRNAAKYAKTEKEIDGGIDRIKRQIALLVRAGGRRTHLDLGPEERN